MPERRRWQALHAVDQDYLEALEVFEQSDGSFVFTALGAVGTHRDPHAAMREADAVFKHRYASHSCGRICSPWAARKAVTA